MALWKCSHQCHWFAYQMNLISGWIILLLDKKYRITFCLLAGWRCAWHLLGVLSYCQTRIRSYSPEQHVCCRYECFQWKFDSDIKIYIYIYKMKYWCQNSKRDALTEFLRLEDSFWLSVYEPCLYTECICYCMPLYATWLILVNDYI